jgi:hypothetical protein
LFLFRFLAGICFASASASLSFLFVSSHASYFYISIFLYFYIFIFLSFHIFRSSYLQIQSRIYSVD